MVVSFPPGPGREAVLAMREVGHIVGQVLIIITIVMLIIMTIFTNVMMIIMTIFTNVMLIMMTMIILVAIANADDDDDDHHHRHHKNAT